MIPIISDIIQNSIIRLNPHSNKIAYFGTNKLDLKNYLEIHNVKNKDDYIYVPKDVYLAGSSFKAYIISPTLLKEELK